MSTLPPIVKDDFPGFPGPDVDFKIKLPLTESRMNDPGVICTLISVELIPLDVVNRNNRIYPTDVVCKALANIKSVGGTVGLPEPWTENNHPVRDVAFIVRDFDIIDHKLVGNIGILDTERGRFLRELLSTTSFKDILAVTPVGMGTVDDDTGRITDYKLSSFAIIPAYNSAFNDASFPPKP